jgi:2,4-dienoyl-CoA reductase (NADPH2)
LARIAAFVHSQGAVAGIQLAHAGRKASCAVPWRGGAPLPAAAGGWVVCGPSPIPFDESSPTPKPLAASDIVPTCTALGALGVLPRVVDAAMCIAG